MSDDDGRIRKNEAMRNGLNEGMPYDQLPEECDTLYTQLAAIRATAEQPEKGPDAVVAKARLRYLAGILNQNEMLKSLQDILVLPSESTDESSQG